MRPFLQRINEIPSRRQHSILLEGDFSKSDRVAHVRDIGLGNADDEKIKEYAAGTKAVLITRDLDFANIILHPIKTHCGVIVLRVPSHFTAKHIISLMRIFFSKINKTDLACHLTILEPGRYRTRSK